MAENTENLKVKELEDGSLEVGEPVLVEDEREVKEETVQDDDRTTTNSDHEDEQGHEEETAEEAEARRERNRQRRAQNKASRKEYIESLKRELAARDEIINDLSTRVASVEQRSVGNQAAQIDQAMQEAERYYTHFKEVNRKAIELADGNAAVDAQEKMFAAQQRYQLLSNAKKQLSQQTQQPKPLDPRLRQNAQEWMERNPWYDPSGSDADSDLVLKIDNRLVQEGWNPSTKEYWEELDSRVKKYLPHKTVSSYNKPTVNQQSRPKVPVAGSGQESNSTAAKGTYRLSPERVKALKEAGIYDDPVKRADAIRRFQEYDRTNGNSK